MSDILGNTGTFLAVLAALGSTIVYLTSAKQKGRISVLETRSNDLLRDVEIRDNRIKFLEAENARQKLEIRTQEIKIQSLDEQMKALGAVIRGEAEFSAIRDHIDAVLESLNSKHDRTYSILSRIEQKLGTP